MLFRSTVWEGLCDISVKSWGSGVPQSWARIPSLPLTSCVTLGEGLHFSEPLLCGMRVVPGPGTQLVSGRVGSLSPKCSPRAGHTVGPGHCQRLSLGLWSCDSAVPRSHPGRPALPLPGPPRLSLPRPPTRSITHSLPPLPRGLPAALPPERRTLNHSLPLPSGLPPSLPLLSLKSWTEQPSDSNLCVCGREERECV